jgi:hypothetical protein
MTTETFSFGSPAVTNGDDGVIYVLGTEFTTSGSGSWTGNQWFAPVTIDGNNHYVLAYLKTSATTGTVLASKVFTPTSGILQTVSFTTPLAITSGNTYVACVLTQRYTATSAFGWPITTAHLTAAAGVNGRFVVTSPDTAAFPQNVSGTANSFHISPSVDFTGTLIPDFMPFFN